MPEPDAAHYLTVADALAKGRVIPFFGAGVNLCDRVEGEAFTPRQGLPSGSELAAYLVEYVAELGHEIQEQDAYDLVRVSQYVAVMVGDGPLYAELRSLLDVDYTPLSLHRFFATFQATLQEKGYPPRPPLLITTNYDDLMERAFEDAGQPFDLITYVAEGEHRGKFIHRRPDGSTHLIERPNEYAGIALDDRRQFLHPVVLKIHGAVDREDAERDSFVITEDDYIDYLTRTELASLIPATLAERLKRSHFLFLGYGLRDWNLRVILQRVWGQQRLSWQSWAIQRGPSALDRRFWDRRGIDVMDEELKRYIATLQQHIDGLKPAGRAG